MASPQVGFYTALGLAILKAVIVIMDTLSHIRLSRETRREHLRLLYHAFDQQLIDIEGKLREWHSQFDGQHPDIRERFRDTPVASSTQVARDFGIGMRTRGVPHTVGVQQLARRINKSLALPQTDIPGAIDDFEILVKKLSTVSDHVDRGLTAGVGDSHPLNRARITAIGTDIQMLRDQIFPVSKSIHVSFQPKRPFKKIRRSVVWTLRLLSLMMAAATLILGGFTFIGINGVRLGDDQQCWVADADIVGDGVRAGTWLQAGVLFLAAFLGTFHANHTPVKELGSGLLIMHISLSFAFLGPLIHKELSPIDAILGSMVLDVQNSALSIQLIEKETLAARWQVAAVILVQLLGLTTIAVLVSSFTRDALVADECRCFSVFWWSWFGNCSTELPNQVLPFWIYYGLRWLSTTHLWYFSATRTKSFDRVKKLEDNKLVKHLSQCPCGRCGEMLGGRVCRVCRRPASQVNLDEEEGHFQDGKHKIQLTCHSCGLDEDYDPEDITPGKEQEQLGFTSYRELPTSVSLLYLEYGAFGCLTLVAAELTIDTHAIRLTSPVYSIGQIIAIVVAGSTIIRVSWVTIHTILKEGLRLLNREN